jgi:hypothetical protein
LPDKPDLSRWSLKYTAFGQNLEFSWLSRNMQEKIAYLTLLLLLKKFLYNWYFLFMFYHLPAANSKSENPLAITGRSSQQVTDKHIF